MWLGGPLGWGLATVGGLILLVWGADYFIENAARLAKCFGVSRLVIGLLVVAFGTSAPELVVSTLAALRGDGGLGVGNAVGSNIANVGLILGISTMIRPLNVNRKFVRFQFPMLALVTIMAGFVLYDAEVGMLDGLLLAAGFFGFIFSSLQRERDSEVMELEEADEHESASRLTLSILFLVGLAALLLGSQALVWGAVSTATAIGIDSTIIGLSVVAIGTSLPELAASLAAVRKGEDDLAVGNVIGSNLFNLLTVLAVPGLIGTTRLPAAVFRRDYLVMLGLTALLIGFGRRKSGLLARRLGFLFVAIFFSYMAVLVISGAL